MSKAKFEMFVESIARSLDNTQPNGHDTQAKDEKEPPKKSLDTRLSVLQILKQARNQKRYGEKDYN